MCTPFMPRPKAEPISLCLSPSSDVSKRTALPTCSCATLLKSCAIEGQTRFHAAPSTRDQSPGVPGRWPARSSTPGHEIPPTGWTKQASEPRGQMFLRVVLALLICLLGLGSLALYDPHESLTDMSPTL